nr:YdcF family protein [aff. Roholtiella sp. LEGE 12411]
MSLFVKQFHRQLQRYWIFSITGFILILLLIIPLRLAIAYYQAPQPQAILTLGAWIDREEFTAEFARWYPSLEIWVSSGSFPYMVRPIFQAAGIRSDRLHLDYRAVDTVTNFTTLVPDFKQRQFQHLYLITSDYHMPRAKAIATLVLGSQGIAFTPLSVPSNQPKKESIRPIIRDIGRSILWIFTGRTGAKLQPFLNHYFSQYHFGLR